jgi:uncharacterized protein YbjQ (UPF0145 family)
MDNIENARTTAVETLKERKQQMKNKAYISTQEPSFTVGDIVYVYRPVVTHGTAVVRAFSILSIKEIT